MDAIRARRLTYVRIDFDPEPGLLDVNIDDERAARSIVEHLTSLGHVRFGIAMPHDVPAGFGPDADAAAWNHVMWARLAGWRAGLEAAGIDWSTVPVAGGPGKQRETGRIAGGRLLDRADRPTAIVAVSDLVAIGVMDAAAERGISIPSELSVAGFDDVPEAAAATPPLTTVRQPHRSKGSEAVRLLLEGPGAESVLLPTELVVRASTAPAP
jgi:DNA-binding LacI/PurR family transcriptional regulator